MPDNELELTELTTFTYKLNLAIEKVQWNLVLKFYRRLNIPV